jgi:hypothetical protein
MKKLAIFVEGQTEQIFIERLLIEIAGAKGLQIQCYTATGGACGARSLKQLKVSGDTGKFNRFVMLVNSSNDGRVRSDIGDQYDGLVNAGYSSIIGIRDVYPDVPLNDINKLRNGLHFNLKASPIQVLFVLGVMEIESWFIAEHTHFTKLSPSLTVQAITTALGFDPESDDLQMRPNPASDLHASYKLAGFAYNKSRKNVERTVNLLDYARLYLETPNRFPDFAAFIASIDSFLS